MIAYLGLNKIWIILCLIGISLSDMDIDLTDKCDEEGEIENPWEVIKFLGCDKSIIRFTFIPKKTKTSAIYSVEVKEGDNFENLLISFENEEFVPSPKKISLSSHHSKVKFVIGGSDGVPFSIAYEGIPKIAALSRTLAFGTGKFSTGEIFPSSNIEASIFFKNYAINDQYITLQYPAKILSDIPVYPLRLTDPEYLMTTIHSENGRIGLISASRVNLGLKKLSEVTEFRFTTTTRSQNDFEGLELDGHFDLGEEINLTTILPPPVTPTPFPIEESFRIYFMFIDEDKFFKEEFKSFKIKLSEILGEKSQERSPSNIQCKLLYDPPIGFKQCRKDCGMSEQSTNRGCGKVSVVVERDIAHCASYSTEDFKTALEQMEKDLSESFQTDIRFESCLGGMNLTIIASAAPLAVLVIVFASIFVGKQIRDEKEAKKRNVGDTKESVEETESMEDEDPSRGIGINNEAFFKEWS